MSTHPTSPEGLINLYKPVGRSSAQYVYRLRPVLGIRKIGHAGSLDPFADGVLLACVGPATRLVERLMGLPKRYRTTLRLGVTNQTFDTEQPFEPVAGASPVARPGLETAVNGLIGEIQQVPPAFSALKISGVPSYVHARRKARHPRQEVPADSSREGPWLGPEPLASRTIRIDRAQIVEYEWPKLTLDILCGRGTYIRAIARDLGAVLGCGACCETLTRTAVGPFQIEDAVNLEMATREAVHAALLPVPRVLQLLG